MCAESGDGTEVANVMTWFAHLHNLAIDVRGSDRRREMRAGARFRALGEGSLLKSEEDKNRQDCSSLSPNVHKRRNGLYLTYACKPWHKVLTHTCTSTAAELRADLW